MRIMKYLKKILKSQAGVSMTETLVGIGLLGVVSVITISQSGMMKKMNVNLTIEEEMINLHADLSEFVTRTGNCNQNFLNKDIPSTFDELVDGSGNPIFSKTQEYLGGKGSISEFGIEKNSTGDGVNFTYTLVKSAKDARNKIIKKRINLLVETDDSITTVERCFSFDSSLELTVREQVAKAMCANGQGYYNDTTKTCLIPGFGFDPHAGKCPDGEALRTFRLDGSVYKVECSDTFVAQDCPLGWIKRVNSDGSFECAQLSDYIDTSTVNYEPLDKCHLVINGSNKIALSCASGCTPSCPTSDNVCSGVFYQGPDSCGSSCAVTGTKTTGECCVETCPLPNAVCAGTTYTGSDGCGGTCNVVGTKTTGECAPPPACSPPTCSAQKPNSCLCLMAKPPIECPADTDFESCYCDGANWCVNMDKPAGLRPSNDYYNGSPACFCTN